MSLPERAGSPLSSPGEPGRHMTTRHAACKHLLRSSHLVPWALTAGLAADWSIAKHPGQLNAQQGWVLGSQIAWGDLESEKPASGARLLWLPGHPLPPAVLSLSSIPAAPQEAAPRPTRPIRMVTPAITCNPPQEVSGRGLGRVRAVVQWAQPDPGGPRGPDVPGDPGPEEKHGQVFLTQRRVWPG